MFSFIGKCAHITKWILLFQKNESVKSNNTYIDIDFGICVAVVFFVCKQWVNSISSWKKMHEMCVFGLYCWINYTFNSVLMLILVPISQVSINA